MLLVPLRRKKLASTMHTMTIMHECVNTSAQCELKVLHHARRHGQAKHYNVMHKLHGPNYHIMREGMVKQRYHATCTRHDQAKVLHHALTA